jgi:hypothetical protein
MVKYWVLIYVPNDTNTNYFVAGFTTERVSFGPTTLKGQLPAADDQVLQSLNEIRAHDTFAAIVPEEFSPEFAHKIVNYATSAQHNPNIGIAIRVYSEDTSVSYNVDFDNPLPLSQKTTLKHHAIATLKLFKCKFQAFTAATDDETYTVSFSVTAGDKLILGPEPGTQGDWETATESDVNPHRQWR